MDPSIPRLREPAAHFCCIVIKAAGENPPVNLCFYSLARTAAFDQLAADSYFSSSEIRTSLAEIGSSQLSVISLQS
jgi:hypothetical protein